MVRATARRRQGYTHDVEIQGGHRLVIDEPEEAGGANQGPSPTRTLAGDARRLHRDHDRDVRGPQGLGRRRARGRGRDGVRRSPACLGRSSSPCDSRRALTEDQVERLRVIAGKCPVHRALQPRHRGLDRATGSSWSDVDAADGPRAAEACAVTGASRGIGREVASGSAPRAPACCSSRARRRRSRQAAAECARDGGASRGRWPSTSPTPDAGERIVAAATESFGQLDVLVNNAGTAKRRSLEEVPDEDWQAAWELNVMAPLRAMRAAAPGMAERGWGRIVNVCSSAAKRPSGMTPEYSVTKAAELSLSRVFADALREGRASWSTPSARAPPSRSCGWSPAASSTSPPSSPAAVSRDEALAAAGAGRPIGRLAEVERDRRRDRLPVLGARLLRRRRRLERRRRHRPGDHLDSSADRILGSGLGARHPSRRPARSGRGRGDEGARRNRRGRAGADLRPPGAPRPGVHGAALGPAPPPRRDLVSRRSPGRPGRGPDRRPPFARPRRRSASTRRDVELVGALPPVGTFVTGYKVHPFVGLIPEDLPFRPNPDEVAAILLFRLEELRAGFAMRRLVRRGIPIRTPTYVVGEHLIWGATARILGELLDRVDG